LGGREYGRPECRTVALPAAEKFVGEAFECPIIIAQRIWFATSLIVATLTVVDEWRQVHLRVK
jgi:hypothetical protein